MRLNIFQFESGAMRDGRRCRDRRGGEFGGRDVDGGPHGEDGRTDRGYSAHRYCWVLLGTFWVPPVTRLLCAGCGTFANDESCAVSSTGHGEAIARVVLARHVAANVDRGGSSAREHPPRTPADGMTARRAVAERGAARGAVLHEAEDGQPRRGHRRHSHGGVRLAPHDQSDAMGVLQRRESVLRSGRREVADRRRAFSRRVVDVGVRLAPPGGEDGVKRGLDSFGFVVWF